MVYAVDRGLADAGTEGTLVEAQHAGTYITLAGLASVMSRSRVHRALKAIKRPRARWVFTPDKSLDLHSRDGGSLIREVGPDAALSDLVDPTQTKLTGTPTKTAAGDGATTYAFSATDLVDDGESGTGTVTINASGVVTAFTSVSASDTEDGTYTYGTQQVALPAKSKTVTVQRLSQGLVLSTLPHQVKLAAKLIARAATRRAHNHTVTVAAVRAVARQMVRRIDHGLGSKVFTATPTARGVRITGTNRFTRAHVSYTITATGKKAAIHKG